MVQCVYADKHVWWSVLWMWGKLSSKLFSVDRLAQKRPSVTASWTLAHDFAKWWLIFKTDSLWDSAINVWKSHHYRSWHILKHIDTLPHEMFSTFVTKRVSGQLFFAPSYTSVILHNHSLLWILYSQCCASSKPRSMWLKQSIESLHSMSTICP